MPIALSLTPRDSVQTLRRAVVASADEAQKTRLRGIIRIKEGASRAMVARDFVVDSDTVTNWIKEYNASGIVALAMSKGGRPLGNPKWDTAIFDALTREIDKGGRYWSVPLMQEWIKETYKKEIPENTVWYHVRDLNYSFKSARPHPSQGNTEAQDAFKKGALHPFSRKSGRTRSAT